MLVVNHELHIPGHELRFSFSRSSGPGGQSVNKLNSKALLRWNPSANLSLPLPVRSRFLARFSRQLTLEGDLLLSSEESRSQKRNQEICLEKLKAMLLSVAHPPKKRIKTKPSRTSREKRKESKRRLGEKKRQRSGKGWE